MAYCTYSDVDALMQITHSVSTRPNLTDITDFCADISAEMDGVASASNYVVPITSVAGLKFMNSYATMGAAVRTWHAGLQSNNAPANVDYWDKSYTDFISLLKSGKIAIPAETTDNGTTVSHGFSVAAKADRYWIGKRTVQNNGVAPYRRRRPWGW